MTGSDWVALIVVPVYTAGVTWAVWLFWKAGRI